jgi:hypothetical protein
MFNFRSFVPAAAVLATMATAALAQTEGLRFQNNSSYTILRIYASPVTNNSWENDILGANVLRPGQYLDVTFRNVYECNYDVLIQFSDGVEMTDVVNICAVGQYNINN